LTFISVGPEWEAFEPEVRKPWLNIFDVILKMDADAVENMCE